MPAIGITGGVSTGKSTFCQCLKEILPDAKFFFADIPLLYETGGETLCDRVVVVACSPDIQLANLMRRMEIERPAAEAMIKSQMPLEEKIKRADYVVWNNGDRIVLATQAASLLELWRQEKWTKS